VHAAIPKNIRKLHLCTGCDKKETGCTRTSDANTLDLQYVSDGVHGCVQVVANGLNGPDVHRCSSEDQWCIYYREVLLTQKLLRVMREICGEFFIFQQGNVPAHRSCKTINLLKRETCVHFTRPFATQQHISEPSSLQKYGDKCNSGYCKFMMSMNRSSA